MQQRHSDTELTRMESTKSYKDEGYEWVYVCVPCKASEWQVSEQEALGRVMLSSGTAGAKRGRCDRFEKNRARVQEAFPSMTSNREIYQYSLANMTTLWSKLAKFIVKKRTQLTKVCEDMRTHAELAKQLQECKDLDQADIILQRMELLAVDEPDLAWASRPNQAELVKASTYADEWTDITDEVGRVTAHLASYYVCCAKVGYEDCLRVTPSQQWDTKDTSKLDARRWFCPCGAKYRAGWGQIIVISRGLTSQTMERSYMRCSVPDWSLEDVRSTQHEEEFGEQVVTGEDLLQKLKQITPATCNLITTKSDGTRRFKDRGSLEALPWFEWLQVFNMVGVDPPPAALKQKRK